MTHKKITIGFLLFGVAIGVLATLTAEQVDHYTSTEAFCGNSCHSMSQYIVKDSIYKNSAHRNNKSGVLASCGDCHIPHDLVPATWVHVKSGIIDIISEISNDFSKPENWQKIKPRLAKKVRDEMRDNDSQACRKCHDMKRIAVSSYMGQRAHAQSYKNEKTCIQCHFNLVHGPTPVHPGFQ
jgi:nitrate/TMAO reductase-like tetraheme cytochrome c subunit